MAHINNSLEKMAFGGIYDQIGGGFARYSTDEKWKVPHFEKMLYDNAQLVELYSEAYQLTKNPLYQQIVYETLTFIKHEMTHPEGGYYSSYDADSEGEEGKYYVWSMEEVTEILGADSELFTTFFSIQKNGNWELDNILFTNREQIEKTQQRFKLDSLELQTKINQLKSKLLTEREKRVKPSLDDKILTSWNALMIKGYCTAYNVFGQEEFLEAALKNATFIDTQLRRKDGGLFRNYKNGKATINGFLEDYSYTISAFTSIYQVTFDETWLMKAKALTDYTLDHFYDKKSGMFYFTSDEDAALIVRRIDIADNVTPGSNSMMANNLLTLSTYFYDDKYESIANQMLQNISERMAGHISYFSNWAIMYSRMIAKGKEVVFIGERSKEFRTHLDKEYLPFVTFAGGTGISKLPILENRFVEDLTMIYVCSDRVCQSPTSDINEVIKQLVNPGSLPENPDSLISDQ